MTANIIKNDIIMYTNTRKEIINCIAQEINSVPCILSHLKTKGINTTEARIRGYLGVMTHEYKIIELGTIGRWITYGLPGATTMERKFNLKREYQLYFGNQAELLRKLT